MAIPPPSFLAPGYDSFEELPSDANDHAKLHGYAIAIRRSTNLAKDGTYRRKGLSCDRGGSMRESIATGQRSSTSTKKTACPFSIKTNQVNGRWFGTVLDPSHNHGPSLDSAAHPIHRKRTWTEMQTSEIRQQFKTTLASARDITALMREKYPDQVWVVKDVKNEIRAAREESLQGYTPTQALVKEFDTRGIKHFFRQLGGHVTAVIWTYPWCLETWKKNPEVLLFDNTYKTNRFKLPFVNICGTTNLHTTFNIMFGLVNKEDEATYAWVLERVEELRIDQNIKPPLVLISDFDKAFKNAAGCVWTHTDQQICVWHVNKNVQGKVKEKWF